MYTGLIALNLYSSYLCQEITSVGSGSESNNKVHQMKQSNRRKTNCNKQLLQAISIEKTHFGKRGGTKGFSPILLIYASEQEKLKYINRREFQSLNFTYTVIP